MDEVLKQLAAMRAEFKGELGDVKAWLAAMDGKFDATTTSLQQLNSWREGVDAQVMDLTASLDSIRKQVDRVVVGCGLSALGTPPGAAASPNPLAPHNAGTTSREQSSGQNGHGIVNITGGATAGQAIVSRSTPWSQEEIEDDSPKSQQKNVVSRQFSRHNFSQAYRPATPHTPDNRNNNVQAKLAALKTLRKARGECFTCGEKWAPGHKCSATIKLQFVEELLAMLPGSNSEGDSNPENDVFVDALTDTKEVFYSISRQATQGAEHSRSMRLLGHIQGHDVLILIDFGASNNFISANMASNLSGVQALSKPVRVKVAGGGILQGGIRALLIRSSCGSLIESKLQQAMEELGKRMDAAEQQIQALREDLNRRFDQLVEMIRKGVPPTTNDEESSKDGEDAQRRRKGGYLGAKTPQPHVVERTSRRPGIHTR
ncbi:hypothetical protein QYE76_031465 [Lolium multiflorum]|uniref:Uncharacterized protein n=1 Tax=Lolium multiflorum TaxID=4521 RepID=A0AAD8QS76_LOLMU|nr:hypothetical protein QYE76_031465 [Lolium multiflorum]